MCRPDHFDIEYEINAWMHEENQVVPDTAKAQWNELHDIYTNTLGWEVELVPPVRGLPDLVFTANGGFVLGKKAVLPTFRHPDRQGETPVFRHWFEEAGYADFLQPRNDFEGEGDALLWNDVLFMGYPWRSDRSAHKDVAAFLGLRPVSLQLTDARFYHLDTAFTVVNADTVALYPKAFTEAAIKKVRDIVPNVIEATDEDAVAYGLNAMSDGRSVVIPEKARHLIETYRSMGLAVHPTPIGEFQKSGGGVKCLTLELRG